jgi:hypothetical protein
MALIAAKGSGLADSASDKDEILVSALETLSYNSGMSLFNLSS